MSIKILKKDLDQKNFSGIIKITGVKSFDKKTKIKIAFRIEVKRCSSKT